MLEANKILKPILKENGKHNYKYVLRDWIENWIDIKKINCDFQCFELLSESHTATATPNYSLATMSLLILAESNTE